MLVLLIGIQHRCQHRHQRFPARLESIFCIKLRSEWFYRAHYSLLVPDSAICITQTHSIRIFAELLPDIIFQRVSEAPPQAVSITIAIAPASSRATIFYSFFIGVSSIQRFLWICFFFSERLFRNHRCLSALIISGQETVLSIENIAKLPEAVSLKMMKITGICCSSGTVLESSSFDRLESPFPCPGSAVFAGCGALPNLDICCVSGDPS